MTVIKDKLGLFQISVFLSYFFAPFFPSLSLLTVLRELTWLQNVTIFLPQGQAEVPDCQSSCCQLHESAR